ncbi:MAG: choice-of-anchor tandem repeat GloVer-containing protein [Candidatus Sulfotelmatobacter sp.]
MSLTAVSLFLASLPQPAVSQTYTVIHNFTGANDDGANPYAGPTLNSSGDLYGTTYTGGAFGAGSVYELSPSGSEWNYSTLYSFFGESDGDGPAFGALALYHGALFGTTEGGGYLGVAFKVGMTETAWHEAVMHSFGLGTDGNEPIGGVVFDQAGNFYGTTLLGGAYGNGTVYEVTPSGVERVLYSFTGRQGAVNPAAAVALDADGNIYGTTSFGGAYGVGAIYELSPSGSTYSEKVLYSFEGRKDGQNPLGGLILDTAGNLYGGTFDGGIKGGGIVYELSHSGGSWSFTPLYSFSGGYGGPYNKLTFDAKGNLYGTTMGEGANGFGQVFRLTPDNGAWEFTDLYDFSDGSDGGDPYGSVAVDSQGNIFGTTNIGGSANRGVMFEIKP